MLPDQVQLLMKMQGYKLPEKRVEQLKRAEARKLKEEQLENRLQKLRMLWNWLKPRFNFMRSLKIPLEVLLAEQMVYKT